MNVTTSPFLSLERLEQLAVVEALIFAASRDENLTLENIRNILLADIIKEQNKTKRPQKTHTAVYDYLETVKNSEPATAKTEETIDTEDYLEVLPLQAIEDFIAEINLDLEESNRPYRIMKFANSYQFVTLAQYGEFVENMLSSKTKKRFTAAQLETLAIIAYKQPITKPEIDKIRGVMSSSEIINILIEKELITISGRKEVLGKPLLYSTTLEFLKVFGLNQLADLPRLTEIEEIAEQKLKEEDKAELVLDVTVKEVPEADIAEVLAEYEATE